MKKDFDGWNKVKKDLNHAEHKPDCYPREIWICSVGANVGVETDGKREAFARPVLVLKKFSIAICFGVFHSHQKIVLVRLSIQYYGAEEKVLPYFRK